MLMLVSVVGPKDMDLLRVGPDEGHGNDQTAGAPLL